MAANVDAITRSRAWAGKEQPSMKTVNVFLVRRPALSSVLALVIALLVAACSPGGNGGSGY